MIGSATAGLYSAKSVENVPADLKKKYFTQVEGSYKISDDIKRCVTFKEHNLLKDSYPKDYDLILCRNVVIYFTDDAKDMIYKNFFNTSKFVSSIDFIIYLSSHIVLRTLERLL